MIKKIAVPLALSLAMLGACADLDHRTDTRYGETATAAQSERDGTVTRIETVAADDQYKLGVGTAVGAVAGGILGSKLGDGTTATVTGAVLGGLAGTYAESRMRKDEAHRVTVRMRTGGTVTIVQPTDGRLREGMAVRVEGSGEQARVVPR